MKKEDTLFRTQVLAMGFSWGAFLGVLILVLSVWCSLTGFAGSFLKLFNSLNPNPYEIEYSYSLSTGANFLGNLAGILINTFYAVADGLIMGLALGFFYNLGLRLTGGEKALEKEGSKKK